MHHPSIHFIHDGSFFEFWFLVFILGFVVSCGGCYIDLSFPCPLQAQAAEFLSDYFGIGLFECVGWMARRDREHGVMAFEGGVGLD